MAVMARYQYLLRYPSLNVEACKFYRSRLPSKDPGRSTRERLPARQHGAKHDSKENFECCDRRLSPLRVYSKWLQKG